MTDALPNESCWLSVIILTLGASSIPGGVARQVTVQKYFEKKRALANSLAIVGTGVGNLDYYIK